MQGSKTKSGAEVFGSLTLAYFLLLENRVLTEKTFYNLPEIYC